MTPLRQRRFTSKGRERTLCKPQRGESYTKGVTSFFWFEFLSITPSRMTHGFVWSEE